jgi:hypothetical protein
VQKKWFNSIGTIVPLRRVPKIFVVTFVIPQRGIIRAKKHPGSSLRSNTLPRGYPVGKKIGQRKGGILLV